MMRFSLACDRGHRFEAWFGGNDDLDAQSARGLVECPACASTAISRALTAPAIATSRRREGREGRPDAPATPAGAGGTLTNARDAALRLKMAELARHVHASTVDVGDRFPEEARRIHFGETEERAIRGRATPDQARALVEDGVGIAPVPSLPEEAN